MPTPARKSSLSGLRRGPQKAHIPYRGDNPEVGKKTGIAVQHVERKSDGFEPFEELMQQADQRTPPKLKGRKKKQPSVHEDEYMDDENGEMSMELDDTPVQYLANAQAPRTPSFHHRAGPSSRPVARSSDVNFDEIPSPRPRTSSQKATVNSRPGPSNLSHSSLARDIDSDSDPDNDGGYEGDDMNQRDFDDYGPQEAPEPTPRRTSFMEMDQEDLDEEDMSMHGAKLPVATPVKVNGKGNKRVMQDEDAAEEEVEEEIARGLDDVPLESDEEMDEPPEPEPVKPPKKKVKLPDEKPPRSKSENKGKKENRVYRDGIRKSKREPYKPLEWWRGEKVVYGKSESSGPILVPAIREIRRIPKEEPIPLGLAGKRKRAKSKAPSEVPIPPLYYNPEEGMDDDTPSQAPVIFYPSGEVKPRRIAWTAKMVNPKSAGKHNWFFDKIFGDGEFIAAGQLIIPPKSQKPSKATKDNTYVFYVIEGAVNLKVHETSLVLATGGMFMVPRGNTYYIENVCERDAKLFFTQARKMVSEEELDLVRRQSAGGQGDDHRPLGRSSSTAAAVTQPNGREPSTKAVAPKRAASSRV